MLMGIATFPSFQLFSFHQAATIHEDTLPLKPAALRFKDYECEAARVAVFMVHLPQYILSRRLLKLRDPKH